MASEEGLESRVLNLLAEEHDGLEVDDVLRRLEADNGNVSPRGVRNLMNRLVEQGALVKQRRRGASGRGAPPYAYFHPEVLPKQFDLFEVSDDLERYELRSRGDLEKTDLPAEERQRQAEASSVIARIAAGHLNEEVFARAVVEAAPDLADEDPVELILKMARWVVDDLNRLADEAADLLNRGESAAANRRATDLETRHSWAKRYFQGFWRLDRPVEGIDEGYMDFPSVTERLNEGRRASLNEERARERLRQRIRGGRVLEERSVDSNMHEVAAGTDASVADLYLKHGRGSFIPPDPVAVMTAAAAMITRAKAAKHEYADFDIYPDRLREYADSTAAVKGLVISPVLRQVLGEDDFKHSRMAAMDLRQYEEDLRVAFHNADWRPVGGAPMLNIMPKPTLIFRDGRAFPLVHRLKDYESGGLYGLIVREEIERFSNVIHHTQSGPGGDTVYGAVVKSPEMSWLAPPVFWYLRVNETKVNGKVAVDDDEYVYMSPFADTAVSHLLFLGLANRSENLSKGRCFVTFRAMRRFSDIAVVGEESLPIVLETEDGGRLLDEDNERDWNEYVRERIADKQRRHREHVLDERGYRSFNYLCSKVGVEMCYAAPSFVYEPLTSYGVGEAAHFLLPRLEASVLTEDPDRGDEHLESMLSWMAGGGCAFDRAHTHPRFDTGDRDGSFPVLVPDVIVLAHEAATFARTRMGDGVLQEIQELVAELKRRVGRPR